MEAHASSHVAENLKDFLLVQNSDLTRSIRKTRRTRITVSYAILLTKLAQISANSKPNYTSKLLLVAKFTTLTFGLISPVHEEYMRERKCRQKDKE